VKPLIVLPDPLAPRPIAVLLFAQVKVVPLLGVPVKVIVDVVPPSQTVWSPEAVAVGIGFTVIVMFFELPVQVIPPLVYTGVTVIVPMIGEVVLLVVVNELILPVPLAPRPIAVLLFTHVNDVAVPLNVIALEF